MIRAYVCLLLLAVVSVGCTVIPSVQYRNLNKTPSMEGMTDAFYMRRSEIEITKEEIKIDDNGEQKINIKINVVPRQYEKVKYGIKAVTDFRSSTIVNIKKVENTDLVASIGTEVSDNTAKFITDVGGVVVSAIGILGVSNGSDLDSGKKKCIPDKKITMTLADNQLDQKTLTFNKDGVASDNDICYTITFHENSIPVDAIKSTDIPFDKNIHQYFYSACRDIDIKIENTDLEQNKFTARISDPRWVQSVQFPPKGEITHHSQCGVSVVTQAVAAENTAAIINAITTEVKAIGDAIKK